MGSEIDLASDSSSVTYQLDNLEQTTKPHFLTYVRMLKAPCIVVLRS